MTLKECREKRGISQTELANYVGLKQTTISQYEKGTRKPKLSVAKKMAFVLGISLDEFVCLSTALDVEAKSMAKTYMQGNPVSLNENVQLSLFKDV